MIQEKYDQSSIPERRAEKLLGELSLEEKMAQISCIFPFGETYGDMEGISRSVPFGIGEVSTLEMRRIETLEEAAQWQRSVQKVVMENSPHHIPAIFHMEGLCGAFIQDTTSFPAGIGRGAGFDPELEERIGEIVGRQERACGITHILAPVLDISRDSRMGRQGETYGEDPTLAAALGTAYVKGIQKEKSAGRRAERGKAFPGFPQFPGRNPRNTQRHARAAAVGNLWEAISGGHCEIRAEEYHAQLQFHQWGACVRLRDAFTGAFAGGNGLRWRLHQ